MASEAEVAVQSRNSHLFNAWDSDFRAQGTQCSALPSPRWSLLPQFILEVTPECLLCCKTYSLFSPVFSWKHTIAPEDLIIYFQEKLKEENFNLNQVLLSLVWVLGLQLETFWKWSPRCCQWVAGCGNQERGSSGCWVENKGPCRLQPLGAGPP